MCWPMRIIIWFIIFLLYPLSSLAVSEFAVADSFRFEGRTVSNESPVPAVIINIYLDGKRIKQLLTSRQGTFVLYLRYNKEYTLELVKKGFFIEQVVIDTKVSDKLVKEGGIDIAIDNDIPVFEIYPEIKAETFDKPILYYVYNERNYYFEVDRRRSKPVSGLAGQIKGIKNRSANAEYKQALNLIKVKNLVEAYISLKKVLELSPSHAQAIAKLKEVENQLKGTDSLDRAYENFIRKADELRKSGKNYQAQMLYKRAAMINSKDAYAASYVHRIDSMLSYQYSERKDEFDRLRAIGDAAFKSGKLDEALDYYTKSLEIIPEDVYVNRQIAAVRKAVENEKKKKEQEEKQRIAVYNQLLSEALALRQKKDYQHAIDKYRQALALEYNNSEVNRLMTETAAAMQQEKMERDYADTIRLADEALANKQYAAAAQLYQAAAKIKPGERYPLQQLEIINREEGQKSKKKEGLKHESFSATHKKTTPPADLNLLLKSYRSAKGIEKYSLAQKIAAEYVRAGKTDSAKIFLEEALASARKNNQLTYVVSLLEDRAMMFFSEGDFSSAIAAFDEAIATSLKMADTLTAIRLMEIQSQNLVNTYQYDRALAYIDRTIELAWKLRDTSRVTEFTTDKGDIYHVQNQYQQAMEYYRNALSLAEKTGDRKMQSLLRNNLGVLYFKMGKLDAALNEFNRAVRIGHNHSKEVAFSYNNIGNIHYAHREYGQAIDYYNKSVKIKEELEFQAGIGVTLYNIATAYLELKKLAEADTLLKRSISIAKSYQFIELMQQSYLTLARVYELANDFRGAVQVYKDYAAIAIAPVSIQSPVLETGFLYGKDKNVNFNYLRKELYRQKILADNRALINKQKEQELMIKDMELQQQRSKVVRFRSLFLFSILSVILLTILSLQIFKRYREKRMLNEMISFQNRQLTDSITYASRIQQAVMPPEEVVAGYFSDYFILNLPKDIVTGDYFFVAEVEGKIYVAVADCTGHGVPGAFMSILGISLTKEIILMQQRALHANEVLNQLRLALINALHQQGREDEAKDGIDIALCVIDREKLTLEYSGANNPAYIIRKGELIELKADRMPIGIHPILKDFDAHVVEILDNDTIYLFSDGYRDQIGEETLKKFRRDEFARLLVDIHSLPMSEQKEKLYQRHLQWRGSLEQTDDILIMGLRV